MKNLIWIVVLVVLSGCQSWPARTDYGNGRFLQIRNPVDDALAVQVNLPNTRTCRVYLSWMIANIDTAKEMAEMMTCGDRDKADILSYTATINHFAISTLSVYTKTDYDCASFIEGAMENDRNELISDCARVATR